MTVAPNQKASLSEWIDWLLHLHPTEIDLGVDRVKSVALKMGLQKPDPLVITVAGTNGKGSSVAMLSAIYQAAGYQVGSFTSPHILDFNERYRINGQMASDMAIIEAFVAIESARGQTKLTFFEFSTLAALYIFQKVPLDVIVLEVGLGGRLDAVNLVDADASLITAIDVDHIDWLGDDRNQIAVEKMGVTRTNQICVVSEPDMPKTAIDFATTHQVNMTRLGQDFSYQTEGKGWDLSFCQQTLTLPNPSLPGKFQLQNASGVVVLVLRLASVLTVSEESIRQGLVSCVHAGRLEKRQLGNTEWLIDVAHNPQSAEVLAEYLADVYFSGQAVFSALADKDILPMVKLIQPFVTQWHIADLKIARSTEVGVLKQILISSGVGESDICVYNDLSYATDTAKMNGQPTLVWGSFFTVSQVLMALHC